MLLQSCHFSSKEIIEDGNSFKPVARTTTNVDGTSTSTIPGAVTADEKIQKKNDLKARSILMMTLPSEHLLTFNQYKDAKTLFEAIEASFCGNEATKKTQKTLLKHMYENFNASSSESLDSIFTQLQKIVSQLAILGENISQEDLNFKFLRSLPSEWSMHVVNVAFVSTPSSTNDINTSNVHVSTASSSLSTASSTDNTARLSDATIYAFLANQPNGSQLVHEDLEQIHEDDLKEMDLKWQLALLSMKARRNPRSQENRSRNQDSSRRTVNVEESSSKAMLAIDGAGFDLSFMTEEEVPTNFALMVFSDSELNKSEFDLANYKRGLASVEEQLVFHKKNKGILCDQIAVRKRDASFNESEINALKIQIERLKKEKESNQIKIDNFKNASKSLDKLIGSQISDNNRKGVGYNVVAPPPTGLFAPPTIDLSSSGLKEFQQPEFEGYGVNVNKSVSKNSSNEIKKTFGALIIEDWVSDYDEDETMEKVSESANVQKPKQADKPRKVSQNPRNNSTNWNTPMSKKLGVNSVNTAKGKRVTSDVGEQGINAVKSKACWVWRPKIKVLNNVSKNNESYICKQFDYVDPTGLEFKVLVVYHTTNGHQFTMSNRQERIGYSRANGNCLEQDLKQTKQVYGKALTKLVKKVKHLEDQLKSTTKRRKAKVVISHEEEDLVLEDPSKQGRMSKTKYEDVETEHAEEESFEVHLDVLKRLSKATPEEEVLTV
ncbi:hypothetical protein Tco_0603172 [Tanacetum coccineum]